MKYLILILFLFFNLSNAQTLTAFQIYHISQYAFDDLDDLMVIEYKFKRMRDMEDVNQRVYSNDNDDLNQLIVITVIKDDKDCANVLSIVIKSSENVFQIRKDMSLVGFGYQGKKRIAPEIIGSAFTKGSVFILITDTITSTGAYQILLMCK